MLEKIPETMIFSWNALRGWPMNVLFNHVSYLVAPT